MVNRSCQNSRAGGSSIVWDHWQPKTNVYPIDGTSNESVRLLSRAVSNGREGRFESTVTCDKYSIILEVTYLAHSGNTAYFKTADDGLFSHFFYSRINVDGDVRGMMSMPREHPNAAKFVFLDRPNAHYKAGEVHEPSRIEIQGAKEVRMEFVLADGDTPLLTFHPQDKEFHDFISRKACNDPNLPPDPDVEAIRNWRPTGFLEIMGAPVANDKTFRGRFYLLDEDPSDALLRSGLGSSDGQDTVGFIRRTCQSDQATCRKLDLALFSAAKVRSQIYKQTTMGNIPLGEYHLVVFATEGNTTYVEEKVVKLNQGANVIQFSAIH